MFWDDLSQIMVRGKLLDAYAEQWAIVHVIGDGLYIACKRDAKLATEAAPLFLIKVEAKDAAESLAKQL